jgi:hypothetical protein
LRVCLWPAHAHRRWATRRRCISADARRLLPCTKAQEYSQRAQLVLRPSGVFQAGRGLRTPAVGSKRAARTQEDRHAVQLLSSVVRSMANPLSRAAPAALVLFATDPSFPGRPSCSVYVREWSARGGAGPPDLAPDDSIAGRAPGREKVQCRTCNARAVALANTARPAAPGSPTRVLSAAPRWRPR